eukprot:98559-Alexandrium_andersonii.AAC.1
MCIRDSGGLADRVPRVGDFATSGPPRPAFVGGFGIRARKGAERTPWELRGQMLKSFVGPRSS